MSNIIIDGLVIDDAHQGIREIVKYVVEGLGVYERKGKPTRCVGFVEDGNAYEYGEAGKPPRYLGPVADLEQDLL